MINGTTILLILGMAVLIAWAWLRHIGHKEARALERRLDETARADFKAVNHCPTHDMLWAGRTEEGIRYCSYYTPNLKLRNSGVFRPDCMQIEREDS